MSRSSRKAVLNYLSVLLAFCHLAFAHGHQEVGNDASHEADNHSSSYFRCPDHTKWIHAHIFLMVLAWVFALPVAVTLRKSKRWLTTQMLFHTLNLLGLLTGVVYSWRTPDLYKSNSHSPMGWILTVCTGIWTVLSAFASRKRRASAAEYSALPQDTVDMDGSRLTDDSESDTLADSDSPRDSEDEMDKHDMYDHQKPISNRWQRSFGNWSKLPSISTSRAWDYAIHTLLCVLDTIFPILGFSEIASGFVVYGGIFRGEKLAGGMSHFVKGGIFLWYGFLTLARWIGPESFVRWGWAFNIRLKTPSSKWVPSNEFVESFLLWLYGVIAFFHEDDFEHISITLLFFGGGLFGMLLEMPWMRRRLDLLTPRKDIHDPDVNGFSKGSAQMPLEKAYPSLNPIPPITLMLLGFMMSSHHQETVLGTKLHAVWGAYFACVALARGVTYITLYLKPPTELPSRPPSELVASFCLATGGLLFMLSAPDIVDAMVANNVHVMATFVAASGLCATALGWEVVVFALKGGEVKRRVGAE